MAKINKPTTKRINLLISLDAYDRMLDQVKEGGYKSLTDLIVSRSTTQEPITQLRAEILEVELRHARELLNNALNELDHARMDLDKLQARNDLLQNTVIWHSLPFWKKLGKRLELPNKTK